MSAFLPEWLASAIAAGASDVHLAAGQPPAARIDGAVRSLSAEPVTAPVMDEICAAMLSDAERDAFARDADLDTAIVEATTGRRFRVHAYRNRIGPALALRPIPERVPTLGELGVPPVAEGLVRSGHGLVLVTGATGSGKSSTLAALIDAVNQQRACHILSLEDPVEYVFEPARALINQREIGRDAPDFENGLRAALRSDPDVILVGEMRDLETIRLALRAAETGHLVLSSLHTVSAAKTMDRILDVFPAGDKDTVRAQLATVLRGIISQALLPKVDGGRIAAFEILLATPAVRNLIREKQMHQIPSMMQLGQRQGMQTLQDDIRRLVEHGAVAPREAEWALGALGDEQTRTESSK